MKGYRINDLFGEGYYNAISVMCHETFVLQNTDILLTLANSILHEQKEKLSKIAEAIQGVESEYSSFVEDAYNNPKNGIYFFEEIISEIKKMTGKHIKSVLWLCEKPEDILDMYTPFTDEFDIEDVSEYETSEIVLSDLGREGKLYGYESKYPNEDIKALETCYFGTILKVDLFMRSL